MKRVLLFSLLVVFTSTAYSYPPPDSCLKIYDIPEDSTFSNPEDVRVDSCKESSTYREFYGKNYFNTRFNYNLIPRNGIFPEDTIIEYGINDIDIIYTQAIADFQALETEFGTFKFRESRPDFADTTTLIKRSLFINFDNYVNIDTAIKRIMLFDCIESIDFLGWFEVISGVETENQNLSIYPNPAKEEINLSYDKQINSIDILDLNGKKVLSNQYLAPQMEQSLKIDYLNAGTYFIRINDKVYKRFVKE